MADDKSGGQHEESRRPFLNFRPLLFCAVGLCLGIFICMRVRFGGLSLSDFLFSAALLTFALFPLSWKRTAALLLCVLCFAGLGALLSHLACERFEGGPAEGEYTVEGTVCDFAVYNGRTSATLKDLTFDGAPVGGKISVYVDSEEVRAGDLLRFTAEVRRNDLTSDGAYLFADDIRYKAGTVRAERAEGGDPFLRVNGALYDGLHGGMGQEEADLVYALLTGNSRMMDAGVLASVRKGGIAHIFAVSGLHIGIVYAAVALLFRPLRRWSAIPALTAAMLYTAFCSFPVSALRAVIMCGLHAVCRMFGWKADPLNVLSAAAILILLIFPAEWLTVGFRLSFGACLGLVLFSGGLRRGLKKLRMPGFLASGLSASLSVQLFTFPVLIESFGYVSLWGTLLNLVLIPLLPVLFLGSLAPSFLALLIPSAASVFLAVPSGLASALLFLLANLNVSFVLTGLSLGAGGTVWLAACVALSERVRLSRRMRVGALGSFCLLFSLCLFARNAVVTGCKVAVSAPDDFLIALVRTPESAVLVMDGNASVSDCEEFLARNLYPAPDAAVIVATDPSHPAAVAASLGIEQIYLLSSVPLGLHGGDVVAAEGDITFSGMKFRFQGGNRLVLFAEGAMIEMNFETQAIFPADISVERGMGDLNFYLRNGIIRVL